MAVQLQNRDMDDMADEAPTQAQRTANLARIRDNQRRSRARRKEYLQELETKYRTCEQVGMGASAEIQAAARRVVDENKRLRQILKQQGLSDAEIDGATADILEDPQYPTAANALEGLLGQRRSCAAREHSDSGSGSERKMSTTPPVPAASNPLATPIVQQPIPNIMPPQAGAQHLHYLNPDSAVASNPHFPMAHLPSSYPVPAPMVQPTLDYSVGYDDAFAWQPPPVMPQPPPDTGTASSCYVAADAIRSIKPELGYELEQELGCGDGRDCVVSNSHIFNIMDRYTADAPI